MHVRTVLLSHYDVQIRRQNSQGVNQFWWDTIAVFLPKVQRLKKERKSRTQICIFDCFFGRSISGNKLAQTFDDFTRLIVFAFSLKRTIQAGQKRRARQPLLRIAHLGVISYGRFSPLSKQQKHFHDMTITHKSGMKHEFSLLSEHISFSRREMWSRLPVIWMKHTEIHHSAEFSATLAACHTPAFSKRTHKTQMPEEITQRSKFDCI